MVHISQGMFSDWKLRGQLFFFRVKNSNEIVFESEVLRLSAKVAIS
jgi:hypothetical protein